MATRKGINIFDNYVVHHKFYAFFIHVLCILEFERSDRIVFYKKKITQRPSDTVF